ncbi:MAG: zf-TFIIB domain-containing protein [Alphaproteobacteria bacterium]|nr:zf-TFIIB domain-containing protein [Alphaproteobacteria bacterium]
MDCPRCEIPLQEVKGRRGVTLDHCGRCGGTWYDPGEFTRVFHLTQPLLPEEGEDPVRGRRCTACGQGQLIERSYPPGSGLRVDHCEACGGLWLDQGEAAQLKQRLDSQEASLRATFAESPAEEGHAHLVLTGITEDRTGLDWRVVIGGVLLLLIAEGSVLGFMRLATVFDLIHDERTPSAGHLVAVAELIGFPIGGLLMGRLSPGFTLWEPALAALPAALLMALLTQTRLASLELMGLMALGFVATLIAAKLGEDLQAS